MKVLIDIGHPAQVHFFKNIARKLQSHGHEVEFTTKEKEVTIKLLETYGFKYTNLGKTKKGLIKKAFGLLEFEYKIYKVARRFKPDIFLSLNSPYLAHIAKITGKPHIAFEDTEDSHLVSILSNPFTDVLCTPSCFLKDLGKKQVRIKSYKELSNLHPNYFQPDPKALESMGLKIGDRFIVLRFISWGAYHDVGLSGIHSGSEAELVKTLEQYGRVLITSEKKLSVELEKYRITCPPDKIHSLLYYAQLYIGEGKSMATESCVLGTPAIHIEANSKGVASGNIVGNFIDLRDNYDMLYFYPDEKGALLKAKEILSDPTSKEKWRKKREKLLSEKVDVAAWMTDFIENYPESFKKYKKENGRK